MAHCLKKTLQKTADHDSSAIGRLNNMFNIVLITNL